MPPHIDKKSDEIRLKDKKTINLDEYYEVEYWADKFGVKPEILRLAVENSGSTTAEEVEQFIQKTYAPKK